MAQLEHIRKKIETAEELQSVVRTLKVLAAASIRQYEAASKSLNAYAETIALGLQVILRDRAGGQFFFQPAPGHHPGLIVVGSGHGMCGGFNDQLAAFVKTCLTRSEVQPVTVLALGDFVPDHLKNSGIETDSQLGVPESVGGIVSVVQAILHQIETWRGEKRVDQVLVYSNRPAQGKSFAPAMLRLLPLDLEWLRDLQCRPWPTRMLPFYRMPRDKIFAALVQQHLFVSCYRALAESLACEHAGRLLTTQAAERNIARQLDKLQARFRGQRQQAITEELLDIMANYELQRPHV